LFSVQRTAGLEFQHLIGFIYNIYEAAVLAGRFSTTIFNEHYF